jgi:hypothetical protein
MPIPIPNGSTRKSIRSQGVAACSGCDGSRVFDYVVDCAKEGKEGMM